MVYFNEFWYTFDWFFSNLKMQKNIFLWMQVIASFHVIQKILPPAVLWYIDRYIEKIFWYINIKKINSMTVLLGPPSNISRVLSRKKGNLKKNRAGVRHSPKAFCISIPPFPTELGVNGRTHMLFCIFLPKKCGKLTCTYLVHNFILTFISIHPQAFYNPLDVWWPHGHCCLMTSISCAVKFWHWQWQPAVIFSLTAKKLLSNTAKWSKLFLFRCLNILTIVSLCYFKFSVEKSENRSYFRRHLCETDAGVWNAQTLMAVCEE